MSVRPWSETIPEAKSVLAAAGYAQLIEHIEAERDKALSWAWRLIEAIDGLALYEPGRKGYAGVHRRLMAERDWALRELNQYAEQRANDAPAPGASAASGEKRSPPNTV